MDEEIKNYKLILNAIRRVNRLLVREHDRDKLLHGICDSLIETSIFSSAWIALFNDSGNLKAFAGAGLGELDLELKKMLECGQLPVCVQKALEQSKPILIKEPTECVACPLAKKYADLGRIIVRIKVRGKTYGILAATSHKYIFMEKKNQDLFEEAAGGLVFALHFLELKKEHKRAKEALGESEKKLSSMLWAIGDHMSMMDKELNIIWANETAKKIFGKDIIGRKCYKVYHRRKEPCVPYPCLTLKAFKDGKTHEHDTQVIGQDGKIIYFHCTANVALKDNEGKPTAVIEISRDITEQKRAEDKLKTYSEKLEYMVEERTKELKRALYDTEEARDKIDSILKSVAEGLIVTDIYDRIILMNSAAEDLLNIRFSEVYGRHIDNAIQDIKLREQFKSTLEKKKTGYCFDFELAGENKKHPRIIRARTSMMSDKTGRHTGIIIIIYDVTYEREIDRMKSEFISIAAHELKTPLTSILGFSEILTKRKNISEEKKIKYIDYINKQSNKLANIIDDLLNISRIESGLGFSINKAPCNINKIILETIDYFQELCPARRFDITLPEKPVEITADKDKIDQALKNIISNAIKYSPENSHVCLSARMIEEIKAKGKQPAIEISVSDKGIGMTSEQSKKIFDKFYRVDSSNKAIPGSGLGMHIVKNIVDAHDGRIWVESKFEKGTTVTFTLPV